MHVLNKKPSPNESAADRHTKDNLLGNTEEEFRGNFIFFKHSKTDYLLLEREEKQSQEINKGRAQLTIMKWNKVQRLTLQC